MKTTLHKYFFDLANPADREPYHQLSARLAREIKEGKRGHQMHCFDPDGRTPTARPRYERGHGYATPDESQEITIDPQHLFGNQWNSDAGRVFDWFERYQPNNKLIKTGHWLDITPDMDAMRRNTLKCGYTGQQFPASSGLKFNETAQVLGSVYLKESELYLCRLATIWDDDKPRAKLTDEEREHLMPRYIAAQTKASDAAKAEARAKYVAECEKTERLARMERDGFLWLMDHGLPTENVIFYSHTAKFCIGWRSPLSPAIKSAFLDYMAEFPFEYEFSTKGWASVGTSTN